MKLFQIEEPDGTPAESDASGVAVGIELSATKGAAVAVAVGGNAELLASADGGRRIAMAGIIDAQMLATLLLQLRERAEKALARPVTHAMVAVDGVPAQETIAAAAAAAGLILLGIVGDETMAPLASGASPGDAAVLGAAIRAEDAAPPPR